MQRMDDNDPLMAIGTFSRASLLSIKALRSYHELGLLIPDDVDGATGYRYYRVSQLTDAAVVKRLRDLDLPLKDIAEVVRARDPEVTRKVIAEHETVMRARLTEVTRIVDELQEAMDRPSIHTPVHVREESAVHALAHVGQVDDADYAPFLDHAFAALWTAVQMTGAVPLGQGSARYPAEVRTDNEPVEAYIPIREPVMLTDQAQALGVVLAVVPEATCAVLTHAGPYDTISDSYRRLGAWVAQHAATAQQPVREHYVVSVDPDTRQLRPAEQLRTDIAWPIVPDSVT